MQEPDKIKVMYVTYNSFLWGDNVALLNILDHVMKKGIIPYVIVGKEGDLCKELQKRNIPYTIILSLFAYYPQINSLRDIVFFCLRLLKVLIINSNAENKLIKQIEIFKPDIIHTNVGPVRFGYYTANKLNIPHVWHIREYQGLDLKRHPLFSMSGFRRKLQSSSNNCIAISKGIYEYYKMKSNARIIYDGVLNRDQLNFNSRKENYFLFVGRFSEGKGLHNLIDAFIEFTSTNTETKLFIAGTGGHIDYVDKIRKKISASGLEERILFLGFRKDVFDLMQKASALIVPSHYEGFGFITAEAMFNGCLVIGNNTSGTKEILGYKNNGILYSCHDELVAALKAVIDRGVESYFPMLLEAQQQAVQLYSSEKNAKDIYKYYKDILSNRD